MVSDIDHGDRSHNPENKETEHFLKLYTLFAETVSRATGVGLKGVDYRMIYSITKLKTDITTAFLAVSPHLRAEGSVTYDCYQKFRRKLNIWNKIEGMLRKKKLPFDRNIRLDVKAAVTSDSAGNVQDVQLETAPSALPSSRKK